MTPTPVPAPKADAKKKYFVILAISVDGKVYGYGSVAELDIETAAKYSHALMAWEDK